MVSLFFVIFRIAVRIKYFQKVWADDILILAAWVMLLATASLYQSQAKSLYAQYPLVTGQIESTPERLAKETTLLRVEVAEFYLLYSTLWSVKLSVLLFFRRIFNEGQSVRYLELWWYFITGFTVVSWVACLGTIPYNCLLKSLPHILSKPS